jgi:hypothetical protein
MERNITYIMKNNKPGVLMSTVPKSGSVYIWGGISEGLGLKQKRYTGGIIPFETLTMKGAQELEKGGTCTQTHILYNSYHKTLLSFHIDKMMVHVRDLRMATLEWVLHIINLKREHDKKIIQENKGKLGHDEDWFNYTLIPEHMTKDYFLLSLQEKIEVQINNWLPLLIDMVDGWMRAEEDKEFQTKILFTTYEEFVQDENAFWDKVLGFYGIDRALFKFEPFRPEAPEDPLTEGDFHFRNAKIDEWRELFTEEQKIKATDMIPDRFYKRFAWKK